MYHHRETIKLTHYDEAKKRAHDSQIVRAKENLKNKVGEWMKFLIYSFMLNTRYLNETVLLSTQNTLRGIKTKKQLHFYVQKFPNLNP